MHRNDNAERPSSSRRRGGAVPRPSAGAPAPQGAPPAWTLYSEGDAFFGAVLDAVAGARQSVRLETYIFILDEVVYIGSSNLDPRSLRLNYELMVRLANPELAAAARSLFADCRCHCVEVRGVRWLRQRSLWMRLKQRFAHFVMARLDPWVTRTQWRMLPD